MSNNPEVTKAETLEHARAALLALQSVEGVEINVELCGSWFWIDGDTRPVKEILKQIGCLWNPNKGKWFWRDPEQQKKRFRGSQSMSKIRLKYGSEEINEAGG